MTSSRTLFNFVPNTTPESEAHNKLYTLDKVGGNTFIQFRIRMGMYSTHRSRNRGKMTWDRDGAATLEPSVAVVFIPRTAVWNSRSVRGLNGVLLLLLSLLLLLLLLLSSS